MSNLYITNDLQFAANAVTDIDMIISNMDDFNNYARALLLGRVEPPKHVFVQIEGSYRIPVSYGYTIHSMDKLTRKFCRLLAEAGVHVPCIELFWKGAQGREMINEMSIYMVYVSGHTGRFYTKMKSSQVNNDFEYANCT